jgi:thioredoxin reductase (NADPH)
MLCNCPSNVSSKARREAADRGIDILDEVDNVLPTRAGFSVVLANGKTRRFDLIYSAMGCQVRSELAVSLGALCDAEGFILVNKHQATFNSRLYAVGDVVSGLKQISVGFGHAALAATDIHNRLPRAA